MSACSTNYNESLKIKEIEIDKSKAEKDNLFMLKLTWTNDKAACTRIIANRLAQTHCGHVKGGLLGRRRWWL